MSARKPEEWGPLFQQYMREGNLEGVLSLYEPAAAHANRSGQVRIGHAKLREEFGPIAASKTDFTFKTRKVVQTGGIAKSAARIAEPIVVAATSRYV